MSINFFSMLLFFGEVSTKIIVVQTSSILSKKNIEKLVWLFDNKPLINTQKINGLFIGPRASMVSPWSTNAVEITQNMGINGILRIEEYFPKTLLDTIDKMLFEEFNGLDQNLFKVDIEPENVKQIFDISYYNEKEGLALSKDEINYLKDLSKYIKRPLTDSEVFGFSQVNSEHCRHKIFNEIGRASCRERV